MVNVMLEVHKNYLMMVYMLALVPLKRGNNLPHHAVPLFVHQHLGMGTAIVQDELLYKICV